MNELTAALNADIIQYRPVLLTALIAAPIVLARPLRRLRQWVYQTSPS